MPRYSVNRLQNSSASQGTQQWQATGVSTTTNSGVGSGSFMLTGNARMSQNIPLTRNPRDFRISALFYSERLSQKHLTNVSAFVKCTIHYVAGPNTVTVVPCMGGRRARVPGTHQSNPADWISITAHCIPDENRTLESVTVEILSTDTAHIAYFTGITLEEHLGDPLSVIGQNGEQMLDEFGINADFIKPTQNPVLNSSFESFHMETGSPTHWVGGKLSNEFPAYSGLTSVMLEPGESIETSPSATLIPMSWGYGDGLVSIYMLPGTLRIEVINNDRRPVPLVVEGQENATYYDVSHRGGELSWERAHVAFKPGNARNIALKFTNKGDSRLFLDAVQIEKNSNGKWPSFYGDGPSMQSDENPIKYKHTVLNSRATITPITGSSSLMNLRWEQFTTSHVHVGVAISGYSAVPQDITIRVALNSVLQDYVFRQTVQAGYSTLSPTFLLPLVPEGLQVLDLRVSSSNSDYIVEPNHAQMYLSSYNMVGGMSESAPNANVQDDINIAPINNGLILTQSVTSRLSAPIRRTLSELVTPSGLANVTIESSGSITLRQI